MNVGKLYAKGSLFMALLVALNGGVHLLWPNVPQVDMVLKTIEVIWLVVSGVFLLSSGAISLSFINAALFTIYCIGTLLLDLIMMLSIGKSDSALFLVELRIHPTPLYWTALGFAAVWGLLNLVAAFAPVKKPAQAPPPPAAEGAEAS